VTKFKARWVARGFEQREGTFGETYSPVADGTSRRTFLSIVANEGPTLRQGDVKTAFLYAKLEEPVWMTPPPGYVASPDDLCHVTSAVYGLRQSPKAFYDRIASFLARIGMIPIEADKCVFNDIGQRSGQKVLLMLYVNDFVVAGTTEGVEDVFTAIGREFEVDDRGSLDPGELLGMEFSRDRSAGTISISQRAYIDEVLDRFDSTDIAPRRTPMDSTLQLWESDCPSTPDVQLRLRYQELVGCLNYLVTCTRYDLAYAVSVLSRFCNNPGTAH
jgi:hypothetical protein